LNNEKAKLDMIFKDGKEKYEHLIKMIFSLWIEKSIPQSHQFFKLGITS